MISSEEEKQKMKKYYWDNLERERKRKVEYYWKNKERINQQKKQQRQDNLEESREKDKLYYKKNKEGILKRKLDYAKKTHYKAMRKFLNKPEIKELNKIRDRTKHFFPLEGKRCEFCNKEAEEHHHITKPYQFDKFQYVCKECHKKIHNGDEDV